MGGGGAEGENETVRSKTGCDYSAEEEKKIAPVALLLVTREKRMGVSAPTEARLESSYTRRV
jgi:hypothetical protein